MISELVRIAIGQFAINSTWEALQSPDLSDAQLRELQSAWESVDFAEQTEAVLAMERVSDTLTFSHWRESYPSPSELGLADSSKSGLAELRELGQNVLEDPKEGAKALWHRYPGYWTWKWWQSYDDELVSAETVQACLETVRAARKDHPIAPVQKQLAQQAALINQAHPGAGTWLGFLVGTGGSLERLLIRVGGIETQRSLLITAIALKRYHLKHSAYPAELTELIPDFFLRLPLDPMDGQPLRYHLKPDGTFLLYSVGEDGHDDGGDPTPTEPATRVNKSWWRGIDAVWPSPATKEEVTAEFERVARSRNVTLQIRPANPLAASPTNSAK